MATPDLGFVHRFLPGRAEQPVLLLLHGTGGDESDLLPLGEALLPGAPRLSPRGKVLENGMPRFFRRLAEGVFDLDDLRTRTARAGRLRGRRRTRPTAWTAQADRGRLLQRREHRGRPCSCCGRARWAARC